MSNASGEGKAFDPGITVRQNPGGERLAVARGKAYPATVVTSENSDPSGGSEKSNT